MGKLIVFEGTDGTGKSTQFALLTKRLQNENVSFRRLQFPQYLEPSSALIRMYLNGEFGENPNDVNAYAASTFYAVDRFASYQRVWKNDYASGGLILSDRYTTSNAVHQGGKLEGKAREEFFSWLYDLEFNRMGLPKPDLVLWLDMPVEIAETLMRRRESDTVMSKNVENYFAKCTNQSADQKCHGDINPASGIRGRFFTHFTVFFFRYHSIRSFHRLFSALNSSLFIKKYF